MKKYLLFFLFVLILLPSLCQAKYLYWKNIDVALSINEDSSLNIVEKQEYVFNGDWNGGIRWLPLRSIDQLTSVEVSEGEIKYQPGNLQKKYQYRVYRDFDKVYIKWRCRETAEPTYYYTHKLFTIKYRVTGIIKQQQHFAELYWKAIFEQRDEEVEAATTTIHLPQPLLDPSEIKVKFYTTGKKPLWKIIDPETIYFEAQDLEPDEPFEVKVAFPASWVKPHSLSHSGFVHRYILPFLWAIITGLASFIMLLIYFCFGRDSRVENIPAQLPELPNNLPPEVVGALISERSGKKELAAILVNLAYRGYLKITEQVKHKWVFATHDFELKLLKNRDDSLTDYEKELIDTIFSSPEAGAKTKLSERSDNLAEYYNDLTEKIDQQVAKNKYFEIAPEKVISKYLLIGNIILVIGMMIAMFSGPDINPVIMATLYLLGFIFAAVRIRTLFDLYAVIVMFIPLIIAYAFILMPPLNRVINAFFLFNVQIGLGIMGAGLVIDAFAFLMPRKSLKGSLEKEKWLSFKHFLEAENKFKATEKAREIFDRYLPYAIALGVERKWLQRFIGQEIKTPDWFHSSFIDSDGQAFHSTNMERFSGGQSGGAGASREFNVEQMSGGLHSFIADIASGFSGSVAESIADSGGGSGQGGGGGGGW